MAVPKKKTSKSRRDKRRTHWKLLPVTTTKCTNCGTTIMPHNVCGSCGHYKKQKVRVVS